MLRSHWLANPAAGTWVTLSVPVDVVGLTNKKLAGLTIGIKGGKANFDRFGKTRPLPPGTGPILEQGITKVVNEVTNLF